MNNDIPSIDLSAESQGDILAFFQNIILGALAEEGIELPPDQVSALAKSTLVGITQFAQELEADAEDERRTGGT